MRAPSPPINRLDLAHHWLTGLSLSVPIDYGPVLLRRTLRIPPCDGHPALRGTTSGESRTGAVALVSRWQLAGLSLRRLSPVWRGSVSCFRSSSKRTPLPRPARNYPRFWIQRSSSEHRRDFNPPEQCAAQRTLRDRPTSCARSSSACVLGLPDAACGSISRGRAQDLPVLVRGVSVRARGL